MNSPIKLLVDLIVFALLVTVIFLVVVWFNEAVINKNYGLLIYKDILKLGSTALLFSVISWLYNEKE